MAQSNNIGGIHGAIQLANGGELTYIPGFFPAPVADEMFASLRDGITWEQMTIYGHQEPRMTKWFGEFGYTYSGVTRPVVSWDQVPQAVQSIRSAVERTVFGTSAGQFNGVLLNYYRTGDDKIGWHADNEKDILCDSPIASISFGAERRFILRHNHTGMRREITLVHGSLLVMAGTTQRFWKHSVPVERRIKQGRINLTFRMYSRGTASLSSRHISPGWGGSEGRMSETEPEVRDLELVLIRIDADIQPRDGLEAGPLEVFRELYQELGPAALPPVVVFHDEAADVFWLADGHYRIQAARGAFGTEGAQTLPAKVYEGTQRDAVLYAAGANAKHGTPLTGKEKRRVVQRLLHDPEWQEMSDRDIARHVGVSNGFVSGLRKKLESEAASVHGTQIPTTPTRTVQRRGKKFQMKMGKIGRSRGSKAKTAPTATPPDIPAITRDERPTDQDEEPKTDDNREVVESGITMSITRGDDSWTSDRHGWTGDSLRENEEHSEAVITEDFKYLQVAWEAATDEDRCAFLKWIKTDEDQKRWHEAAGAALESFILTRAPLR